MHYSPDDEKIAKIPLVWITAVPTATMHGSCSYAVEVGNGQLKEFFALIQIN
jgi:hypothetical protein